MRTYHITVARVDQPATKLVRYRESRNIIDAISLVLQEAYGREGEWECTRAELVLRAPKGETSTIGTTQEEIGGVPV